MKVQKKINSTISVVAEADEFTELFRQLAALEETFGEEKCAKCQSDNLRYVRRETKDGDDVYEYFELRCNKCKAKLTYGVNKKEGTIYPKRYETNNKGKVLRDDDDQAIKRGIYGWTVYNKETGKEE